MKVKTVEQVEGALRDEYYCDAKYVKEDELNWYFIGYLVNRAENVKVRKSDCLVHSRLDDNSEWEYVFELFPEQEDEDEEEDD